MEIRRGFGTAGTRTSGPVTVGDPLTLLIHMKSEKGKSQRNRKQAQKSVVPLITIFKHKAFNTDGLDGLCLACSDGQNYANREKTVSFITDCWKFIEAELVQMLCMKIVAYAITGQFRDFLFFVLM